MIKPNFRNRVASLALGTAMVFTCVPAGVYADTETSEDAGSVAMEAFKVNDDITYYYTDKTADTYTADGETVTPTEIEGTNVKYYTTDKGTTLYGSASMTYLEYWEGENIESSTKTDTKGSTVDERKEDDLGAFDAVSRATSNHGIFRHGFQFNTNVNGTSGSDSTTVPVEIDPVVKSGKLTGTIRENGTAGAQLINDMQHTFTVNGVEYSIQNYSVSGFQRIPVAVNSEDYAKAEILNKTGNGTDETKTFDNVTIGGKDGSGAEVTASTGGIKTLEADGTYSAASEGKSTAGFDVAVDKVTYEYNTEFSDYVDAYIYLKKADGSALTKDEFLKYSASYLTAEYEYYGDTNPDTDSNAKPIATYGTKNAADTWWSPNHGIRIDAGFNFDSLRLGGSGSDTSADGIMNKGAASSKLGYWKVIYKAAGYNDVEATVEIKNQVSTEDADCEVSSDRKTIKVTGLDDSVKNILTDSNTKVTLSSDNSDKTITLDNNANAEYTVPEGTDLVGYYYLTISTDKYADITLEMDLNPTVSVSTYGDKLTVSDITEGFKKALADSETTVKILVQEGRTQKEVATLKNNAEGVYDLTSVEGLAAGNEYTLSIAAKGYDTVETTFKYEKENPTISLNKSSATIYAKKPATKYRSVALSAKVEGLSSNVTWKSSNTKVATVSSKGVVTAKSAGTATITATANGVSATSKITVKNPSISVKTKVTVKKKKKVSLKAKATPSAKVTYKSSTKKVATVSSSGVVKGKKKGTAKITVSANGISKTVTVKVK